MKIQKKISYKFAVWYLILIVLPVILVTSFNFIFLVNQSKSDLVKNANFILSSMQNTVKEKMEAVETTIHSLSSNSTIISFLSRSFYDFRFLEEYENTVLPLVESAQSTAYPSIDKLYIIYENNALPEGYNTFYKMDHFPVQLNELILSEKKSIWKFKEDQENLNSLSSYEKQIIFYAEKITSPYGKSVGYIIAELKADVLFNELLHYQENNNAFFVSDDSEKILLSNVNFPDNFVFPKEMSNSDYYMKGSNLYISSQFNRIPLSLSLISTTGEQNIISKSSFIAIVIICILSCLSVFLFYSFMKDMIIQIQRYSHDMEQIVKNNFNDTLKINRQDEIGDIGRQFNSTLQIIQTLLKENVQKETAHKDVQLKALLLQINPHFIYNTLDMFVGRLMLNRQYEVAEYMCDFAQMIRYNTVTTNMFISLKEEMIHAEIYVNIQRCQYGDSIQLYTHLPLDLYEIKVMRFLIQPIVENSFQHGFTNKAIDFIRHISISAKMIKNSLIIRVRDRGDGMSSEDLAMLEKKLYEDSRNLLKYEEKRHGIGLENIYERLQLFYGNQAKLAIKSKKGKFTSVFVLIDLDQKETLF